jgi:hypothetical protein
MGSRCKAPTGAKLSSGCRDLTRHTDRDPEETLKCDPEVARESRGSSREFLWALHLDSPD